MKRIIHFLLFFLSFIMTIGVVQSQNNIAEIYYGQTSSSTFDSVVSHRWLMPDAQAGDIPIIRVRRISGQFSPRIRLLDADGELLAESEGTRFPDTDELILIDGLPQAAQPYQIEILADNITSSASASSNPPEYSLTVEKDGIRRATPDEGLLSLGDVGIDAPPELEIGTAQALSLDINSYGEQATVRNSPTPNVLSRVLVTTENWQLAVDQAVPITLGVSSVTFLDTGIGLTIRNSTNSVFFSDEDLLVGFNQTTGSYRFVMQSGTTIITDFSQVRSIEVRDGVVAFRMMLDGDIKRLVFDADFIDLRRLTSGENEAPLYELSLDNDNHITTDLLSWTTLEYLSGEVRVYYPNDARFISDHVNLSIREDAINGFQNITLTTPIEDNNSPRLLPISIDWFRISDIRIDNGQLFVELRNGLSSFETLNDLSSVFVDQAATQFTRQDGTYRRVFPDGTEINTPTPSTESSDILPYESGFRAQNYNNLGENILPLCTCIGDLQGDTPVNPANGNFFYSVTDFSIFGRNLSLNLIRYYNSHDNGITPSYILNSPTPYLHFGTGWRHSYQYELDITHSPNGEIRLIEPDGTVHYFSPRIDNPNEWSSLTLLSMIITQESGLLGTWTAQRTDGLTYHFDRVGRLTRISEAPNRSITLSPMPRTYSDLGDTGIFIVGPYGRRIELYGRESGFIETTRDTLANRITYGYEGQNLESVEYGSPSQNAVYQYDARDLLFRYDDVRSPYLQVGSIAYDDRQRVSRYIQNPDGDLQQEFVFQYEENERERITRRIFTVDDPQRELSVEEQRRIKSWTYNESWQLTNIALPIAGWEYAFTYAENTGTLSSVRTPTQVRFSFAFDERGNLIQFEDPIFTGSNAYRFTYEHRGNLSLLTEIRYPNRRVDSFSWNADDTPQLVSQETLITDGIQSLTRMTRYEYDDWGRLIMLVQPNNVATIYHYDDVGYVSSIWQGIVLEDGEIAGDIADANRALSQIELSYNFIGQPRSITDGRGTSYTLKWNQAGHIAEIAYSDDISIEYTYDDRGRIIGVNDRGQQTTYTYNGLDKIASMINVGGSLLTFDYDGAGNLIRIVDDLQRETIFAYDMLDNLILRQSPTGLTHQFDTTLDPDGNFVIQTEIDPLGRVIRRRYDPLGRLNLIAITHNAFRQEFALTYSPLGYLTNIRDTFTGRQLALTYNLIGDVLSIDVAGSTTSFTYNQAGDLASVTSPAGRTTQYEYDPLANISAVIMPDGSEWSYDYDENSNLLSEINPLGSITHYVYDALNQLISEENPNGAIQTYQYDNRGNLISTTDPNNFSTNFEYDAFNNVTLIDEAGLQTTYRYDNIGRLVEITQPNADEINFTYDAEDNIIALNDGQQTLSYNALGQVTSVTDPLGHTTTYEYSPTGLITSITNPVGNIERYDWRDTTGFLANYTNIANRNYTVNTDALGRVTLLRFAGPSVTQATGTFDPIGIQFSYDDDGYITGIQSGTTIARENGINDLFYRFEYSANGYPIRYTDPRGEVWLLDYDAVGQLVQVSNPNGIETQYRYDDAGHITQVIHFADTESEVADTYTYDDSGNIITYVSPTGIRNQYIYNGNNQLTQAVLAANSDTPAEYVFEYDGGQLELVVDPNGHETRYLYSADKLTRIESEFGDRIISVSYRYDDAGNLINVSLPDPGEEINITYDALDRRVRYVNGINNSWAYSYDEAGNLTQISDPSGSVVAYTYDDYDRVIGIQYPSGSTATLTYDPAGNLRTITLPPNNEDDSQTITYLLNELGQVREIEIGTNVTEFLYDAVGNVIRRINPDETVTDYTYDAANRLVNIPYSDEVDINYTYDDLGQLVSVGNLTFDYDALGRITATESNLAIEYTYDAADNLTERRTDILGTTNYVYDDLYRVQQLDFNGEQVLINHNDLGQITEVTRGNGVRTTISYDAARRPTIINHFAANGDRIESFNYSYDTVGNPIRLNGLNTPRVSYSYDVDQRLISERWLNDVGETVYVVSYRYDDAGNRIEETRNGIRTTFSYNAQNQLIRATQNNSEQNRASFILPTLGLGIVAIFLVRTEQKVLIIIPIFAWGIVSIVVAQSTQAFVMIYDYDANGNVISISYIGEDTNTLNLSYDNENRLASVIGQSKNGDAVETTVTYDALSRLIGLSTTEEDFTFYYDDHTLIGMRDSEGNVERYLNLNGERILTVTGEEILWHLNDRQGNTRRYANADGSEMSDPSRFLEFSSFGMRIFPYTDDSDNVAAASIDVPIEHQSGRIYDPSTGLYFIGLRVYDPTIGRFLQPDPIRQDPIGTLYTYARNRPLVFNDPTGMLVEKLVEPLGITNLPTQINPESLIPRPLTFDIPIAPSVNQQQADETFRALRLLEATRYGVNDHVMQLSPYNDAIYLFSFSPIPDNVEERIATTLNETMEIYESGGSWLPDLHPNPYSATNPFEIFSELEPLLAFAYSEPFVLCCETIEISDFGILSMLTVPQGLSDDVQTAQSLTQMLQPISTVGALSTDTRDLLSIIPPSMAPSITIPSVMIPEVPIEPPALHHLDDLREETFEFQSRIWTIGNPDCTDCVPPVRFNQ